ncbi:MAG: hypothetical protein WAW78_00805 [Propioniciclava sp.]
MQKRTRTGLIAAFVAALTLSPLTMATAPAAEPEPAATCELSAPLYFGGDATDNAALTGVWTWRNSTTGTAGPAWAVAGDYHTRSFLRTLTNTSSGNAARDLHHVTAYYPTAQLAPTISGGAYRQSVWDATYGAFVSQGTFPTGWSGRVTPPAGSTVEVYDAGSWDGTSYVRGSKITSTVAAESVPIPLSRTSPITYNIAGQQVPTRLVQETLSVGQTVSYTTGVAQERPTNSGTYGLYLLDDFTASICLPKPTVTEWSDTSADGLGTVSGTGSSPGDSVTVTAAGGAVIGTATVGPDLTWAFPLTTPLSAGPNPLTATETDTSYSTESQRLQGTSAPAAHPVGTPTLTATITDSEGGTTADAPRTVSSDAAYAVTFTVTNTGTAIATDVTLGAATTAGLSLSSPVCSPDITQSGVTLAPNASATCTATISGLTSGTTGTLSVAPTATSPVISGSVSTSAGYWVTLRTPEPTPTPEPTTPQPTTPAPTPEPTTPTPEPTSSPTPSASPDGTLPFTGAGQAVGFGVLGLLLVMVGAAGVRMAHPRR